MGTAGFGHNVYLGLGEESTYGTAVTRDRFLDITNESLSLSHERVISGSINSIGNRHLRVSNGAIKIAGDVTLDLPYRDIELLFKHALGSVSTGAAVDNSYTHTFSIADALPTGLTVEIFRDSSGFINAGNDPAFLYEGCKINSLSLSASIGAYLSATVGFVGEDENRDDRSLAATVNSDLNSTTRPLIVFTQGLLNYDNITTSIAAGVRVESFDLTINNNLNADRFQLGTRLTREPVRSGKIEVTGSFVADFDGFARYAEFRNSTTKKLILTFTGGAIPNSGVNYSLTLTLPYILPTGVDLNVDGGGIITQTIPFAAFRNPAELAAADQTEMKIALVNGKSSIP